MIIDVMRMNQGYVDEYSIIDEELNADATRFFWFFKISQQTIIGWVHNHSNLSIIAHEFTIKLDHGLSEANYDIIIKWARTILPEGNRLKENFYAAKSMMKPYGLGYQKIDPCPNFYMLYYHEIIDLIECKTCGHAWYKSIIGKGRTFIAHRKLRYFSITPRLQCLFISPNIIEHNDMVSFIWYDRWNEVMVHSSDDEA